MNPHEKRAHSKAALSVLNTLHSARNDEMNYYFTRLDTLKKMRNSPIWVKKSNYDSAADVTVFNLTNTRKTPTNPTSPGSSSSTKPSVKTGDQSKSTVYYVIAALAMIAIILILVSRRKGRGKS